MKRPKKKEQIVFQVPYIIFLVHKVVESVIIKLILVRNC